MQFMLIFYLPEAIWVSPEITQKIIRWRNDLSERGIHKTGNPLKPPGMTNTLQKLANGEFVIDESPLYETEKSFIAFEIIECQSMNEGIQIAKTCPVFDYPEASMEVREIWESLVTEAQDYLR